MTPETTLQDAAGADGNGTTLTVKGYASLVVQVAGTFGATVTFEANQDGTNWVAILGANKNTGALASTATAGGLFAFSVAGLREFRARVSSWASGSVTVRALALGETAALVASKVGIDQTTPGTTNGVQVNAGEAHIGEVGGREVNINATVTRLANTTTYAAGEVVSDHETPASATIITFTNAARINAGSGIILGAALIDGANATLKGVFELWLFDTTIAKQGDNAAFVPTDAELATLIGVIPFNTSYVAKADAGVDGSVVFPVTGLSIPFVCGAASRNLFGLLVVRNAYVPISAEVFTVRLRISQD